MTRVAEKEDEREKERKESGVALATPWLPPRRKNGGKRAAGRKSRSLIHAP